MATAGLIPVVVGKEQTLDLMTAPSKTGLLHQQPGFHDHHDAADPAVAAAAGSDAMHRFKLCLSDPVAAAMRRCAQKLAAHVVVSLDGRNPAGVTKAEVLDAVKGALKVHKPPKKRQTLGQKGRTPAQRLHMENLQI
jgi:hypothetical protein